MKDLTTTVVVVGSGSSGISAAMTLLENKVDFILLEKGKDLGGAGRFGAHGVFALNSDEQKAKKVKYSYEDAFKSMTEYNHYFTNGSLLSRFLKMSGENIKWLEKIGLPTTLEASQQEAHVNDPMVYHKFNSTQDQIADWDRMEVKIKEAGNKVLHETAAIDIDYSNKKLNAIIAQNSDNEKIRINCKYVVYADGGYPGNDKMMHEKYNDADNLMNLGERKAQGTGILAAQKIGADTNHTPVLFAHACAPSLNINPMKRDSAVETLTNLPLFWVDQTGHRFVDESICYDFALWSNAAHNVGGKYYVLLDQKTLNDFKTNEVNMLDAFEKQFAPVGKKTRTTVGPLSSIQADFDTAAKTGEVVKADTIEELAKKLNISLNALTKTIKEYNGAIENKKDSIFLKNPEYLRYGISSDGPYYAIIEHVAILGTLDGVNVNENCQALRKDGSPIENVYVVGNNANGLYGDSYPIFEGVADGFAFCSGRIAGLEIANKINK